MTSIEGVLEFFSHKTLANCRKFSSRVVFNTQIKTLLVHHCQHVILKDYFLLSKSSQNTRFNLASHFLLLFLIVTFLFKFLFLFIQILLSWDAFQSQNISKSRKKEYAAWKWNVKKVLWMAESITNDWRWWGIKSQGLKGLIMSFSCYSHL